MLNSTLVRNEVNLRNSSGEVRGNDSFIVERGCVYWANLGETKGSIQGKIRPFLVTSNWRCNKNSPVITGVALTSQLHKKTIPTHAVISTACGVSSESIALCEQVMPLNKSDLISKIGYCTKEEMIEVEKAIQIQNGIDIKDERIEKIFDISIVRELVSSIEELDEFINKWDNPQLKPIKRSRLTLLDQLKKYCSDFNKNISLFYKDIPLNNNQSYRGNVINA